jgi:serine protease AprX
MCALLCWAPNIIAIDSWKVLHEKESAVFMAVPYLWNLMQHLFLFITLSLVCSVSTRAQNSAYWVCFSSKKGATFQPVSYFELPALDRRLREGISPSDSSDFPVSPQGLAAIESLVDSVVGLSRWFNAAAVWASPQAAQELANLPVVQSVFPMRWSAQATSSDKEAFTRDEQRIYEAQTEHLGASLWRKNGYSGKGVRIALFDGGYKGLVDDEFFTHLLSEQRIKASYDFVRDKKFVFSFSEHGTHVLSCLAGRKDSTFLGLASDAEYLLARTEQVESDRFIREENWVESLEWADKWGADVINSSLIYTFQLYFRDQMDGRQSIITRAANKALEKGMVVVNSAGNEGYSRWEIVGAPADGDSVLTVGAINPELGYHSDFSSFGPTADLRPKPNVSAQGSVLVSNNNVRSIEMGTSFAAPLVAGFVACVRQMHPEWTAKRVFDEVQKSADLYPYFDYAHGFGIPQASYFFGDSLPATTPTVQAEFNADTQQIIFRNRTENDSTVVNVASTNKALEYLQHFADRANLAFVHVTDSKGILTSYKLFRPENGIAAMLETIDCPDCKIRIAYKKFVLETTRREIQEETKARKGKEEQGNE